MALRILLAGRDTAKTAQEDLATCAALYQEIETTLTALNKSGAPTEPGARLLALR